MRDYTVDHAAIAQSNDEDTIKLYFVPINKALEKFFSHYIFLKFAFELQQCLSHVHSACITLNGEKEDS